MKAPAFFVIQLFSLIFCQYNLSGSYVSSYGNSVNNFNFFENRFNLNADWRNWTAWMELEHSNPPELGKSIMGLRISEEAEKLGTDKAEVGVVAYSIRD